MEKYVRPEMDIIEFEEEDIIRTSSDCASYFDCLNVTDPAICVPNR